MWCKKLVKLAAFEYRYPDELRADFQRFYNLNLDGMGTEYSHSHAASLAVMLPDESCIKRTINPALKWTQTEWMLYSIEYSLRWLRWAKTKDASHKRNMPKPMQTPDEQAKIENKIKNTNQDEIRKTLGY